MLEYITGKIVEKHPTYMVLEKKKNRISLKTAYPTDREHTRSKLRKERDEYCKSSKRHQKVTPSISACYHGR